MARPTQARSTAVQGSHRQGPCSGQPYDRASPLCPGSPKAFLSYIRTVREGDRAALAAVPTPEAYPVSPPDNLGYIRVRGKFALAIVLSAVWLVFTIWVALPWLHQLAQLMSWPVALLLIGGIAIVPGGMNAFLAASLLLDRRPA